MTNGNMYPENRPARMSAADELQRFAVAVRLGHLNGADYVPARDDARLKSQALRVFDCMIGGTWLTLGEVATITGDPEPSISAHLRHFRKPRFGSYQVAARHRGDATTGLYEYRLTWPERQL